MWWVFVLLALMTVLRILALMHTPNPVENEAVIATVTPRSVWGTGWGSALDAVMYIAGCALSQHRQRCERRPSSR